jgi:hypothetical protein
MHHRPLGSATVVDWFDHFKLTNQRSWTVAIPNGRCRWRTPMGHIAHCTLHIAHVYNVYFSFADHITLTVGRGEDALAPEKIRIERVANKSIHKDKVLYRAKGQYKGMVVHKKCEGRHRDEAIACRFPPVVVCRTVLWAPAPYGPESLRK